MHGNVTYMGYYQSNEDSTHRKKKFTNIRFKRT